MIRLEQNYRSTQKILEAAGAVVANNKARKGKNLWTDAGARRADPDVRGAGFRERSALHRRHDRKGAARRPEDRVAVLYRTNFQSRQIEEALRRYGRKYIVVGGFSFYQRAEVKDILAYLKVVGSPDDSISLLRIINTPARGIGKTTVEQIEQFAHEHQSERLGSDPEAARRARVSDSCRSGTFGLSNDDRRTARGGAETARSIRLCGWCWTEPDTSACSNRIPIRRPKRASAT